MQQCQWCVSTVSLLVCMALDLHPQITRRHCSKSSVTPLLIWTSQNNSTVSSLVVILIHTGALGSCRAATAPLSAVDWIRIPCVCTFTYLSSSIIFTADMSSSSCPTVQSQLQITHVSTPIYWNTWSISGHTWILGTRVQQTWGKWYIHTIIPCTGAIVMINVGLAQARPNKQ